MSKPIIKCTGFSLSDFWIPPFELYEGEMARLWIARTSADTPILGYDLHLDLSRLFAKKTFTEGLEVEYPAPFAATIEQWGFMQKMFPLTVDRFLMKRQKLSLKEAKDIKRQLALTGEEEIRRMEFNTRKKLTISALFMRNECITFDYYGLSPSGLEDLEVFVHEYLKNGSSVITFDNLHFLTDEYLSQEKPFKQVKHIVVEAT